MRSITEDQEATNEELQSANEELQSGSEELQTLNEELETSKEELQSTNEELTSLNQELLSMNKNLTTARNFAVDVLETVREPWIVLDSNLRIKSANQVFYRTFRTSETAIENKPLLSLGKKDWNVPELDKVIKKILVEKTFIKDYEVTQDFPGIGERTMLVNAREVVREEGGEKLILLVFGDITDKKMIEKSLEKSEFRFKLLTETVPHLIWITNAAGKTEYLNSKWVEYTGMPVEESLGDGWSGLVHPEDKERVMENWNESVKTGELFSIEFRIKNEDGVYNWFLTKALPLLGSNGEIIKWFGSNTNIQIQKEAETALIKTSEQFRQFTEMLPQKVSNADASGKVSYYNKSWQEYTGWSEEELLEKGWGSLFHPEDLPQVQQKWENSLENGTPLEMEFRLLDKAGEYQWHMTRIIPIRNEMREIQHWIGSTTNIEKYKEEEKRKENFLQLVSHELKTPITSIKGYVQLLLNMLKQENRDLEALPIQPSLVRIDEQIIRLTRLISEILDLSRIEENRLDLKKEKFNLNSFIEETIEDIKRTGIQHEISIHQEFHCDITADKDRLGQVVINLVTNAIKYSPVNKTVELRIFETEDKRVAVSITDKGIGIAEKDLKEIFKRFHRVEGKSEDTYAGLGIGLFLARDIIERHGGELKVESEMGEGSVFTFVLPYEYKK